ncbi:hypothetical protein E2C01_058479 [Portunus trituberculatus]|uniref:Uncharacterized protein n=1 Tax=Portunus trituberculatus TaxID=210409 RepID=A0A5B7H3V2_PORTR|nr:hypothetical protein [Portunus trituberculatus]
MEQSQRRNNPNDVNRSNADHVYVWKYVDGLSDGTAGLSAVLLMVLLEKASLKGFVINRISSLSRRYRLLNSSSLSSSRLFLQRKCHQSPPARKATWSIGVHVE